jgi:hypothetical protein
LALAQVTVLGVGQLRLVQELLMGVEEAALVLLEQRLLVLRLV